MKISSKMITAAVLAVMVAVPVTAVANNDYSTVNKSIRIDSGSTYGRVDSVNGAVRIGEGSFVDSVDTVNGSIDLDDNVTVERDIEAVNGSISLQSGGQVGGDVETVNGGIRLQTATVSGNVETVNGSIEILDASEVHGNIMVRKPGGWNFGQKRKPVRVEIGKDVIVRGDLIFEHPVELRLHDTARVGDIIGDDVEMVSN